MTEIDPEFLKQLQEAFVTEAREQVQSFMTSVINLENCTEEAAKLILAEDILRDLHSIKGNSRAAGVSAVEAVCQALESALLSLRRKKELLKQEAADVFHQAIDILDDLICKVEEGQAEYLPENFAEVLHRLKMLDERQRLAMEAAAREAAAAAPSAAEIGFAAEQKNIVAPREQDAPDALQGSSMSKSELSSSVTKLPKTQQAATAQDKSASTRIALWKLDKLLRESEEMLILKQISEQHLEDIQEIKARIKLLNVESLRVQKLLQNSKSKGTSNSSEKDLAAIALSLDEFCLDLNQSIVAIMRRQQTEQRLCFNLVDGFIDSVKSMLMQDFSSLLSLVPKIVRDLARELKKEVDLDVFGAEIEIDRRILEEIKDPVIHLLRNSLDHGIESSEERIRQGKPARASLKIGARQDESGNVQLLVADDGKGINAEKLKQSAIKEGAITAEEAHRMTESEAIDLMYRSAVSTSEKVTEISGRGLGMAIVRERIHDLGGRVSVETQLGKGTTFVLQLPTKLSTFRGIQVMAGKQSYIIPTLHVHYAGRILRSDIKKNGSRNVVSVSGQLTSIQALADVLNAHVASEFKSKSARKFKQLLVLESGERRAGFLVDEIMHEQEVLVRGLSYPLVRVPNISGATILGSGQVVPVLNIADLMETSSKASWADERLTRLLDQDLARTRKLAQMPVYLVDQHSTTLVMIKSVLESEGYSVSTFDSNEKALEGLDLDEPLILLKSSELPETQESGLAYFIRKDLRFRDLPIVFFGSFAEPEGQTFAKSRGGNGYFSKVDFDSRQLLQLIESLT